MTPRELALHAARTTLDKGGEDLVILTLPEDSTIADFVVLVNGRSERQVTTLVDEVYHMCKRHDIPHGPVEGDAGWRLIDCYDVIVHAFTEDMRARYDLDHFWEGATAVDHDAELAALPKLDA